MKQVEPFVCKLQVITFTPYCFNLIQLEERLWNCFALFLETIFSRNWVHVLISCTVNFQRYHFSSNLGRLFLDNVAQKPCRSFLFFPFSLKL